MKPLNFCDIRTGQMRGSPARVMRVLEWITSRRSVRAVLVSVFAGITDLAEFGGLLSAGMEQTPGLRVPVVVNVRVVEHHLPAASQPGFRVRFTLGEQVDNPPVQIGRPRPLGQLEPSGSNRLVGRVLVEGILHD